MFREIYLFKDDKDEQDKHEEKSSDIYRPGKLHFQRKIEDLVFNKKDLRAALEVKIQGVHCSFIIE